VREAREESEARSHVPACNQHAIEAREEREARGAREPGMARELWEAKQALIILM
jgi:hypothetical protein